MWSLIIPQHYEYKVWSQNLGGQLNIGMNGKTSNLGWFGSNHESSWSPEKKNQFMVCFSTSCWGGGVATSSSCLHQQCRRCMLNGGQFPGREDRCCLCACIHLGSGTCAEADDSQAHLLAKQTFMGHVNITIHKYKDGSVALSQPDLSCRAIVRIKWGGRKPCILL